MIVLDNVRLYQSFFLASTALGRKYTPFSSLSLILQGFLERLLVVTGLD